MPNKVIKRDLGKISYNTVVETVDTSTGTYILTSAQLISASVCLITAGSLWQKRRQSISFLACVLFFTAGIWALLYSVELAVIKTSIRFLWMAIKYLIIAFVPLLVSTLFIRYTGWPTWPKRSVLIVLLVVPVIFIAFMVTNPLHRLFWESYQTMVFPQGNGASFPLYDVLIVTPGPIYWAFWAYSYGFILFSIASTSSALTRIWRAYRNQALVFTLMLFLPFIFHLSYLLNFSPIPEVDLTPIGFGFSASILLMSRKTEVGFNVVPIAHFGAVDQITDSVVIIDSEGRIIEMNDSATKVLQDSRRALIGKKCSDQEHPIFRAMHHAERGNSTPREIRMGSMEQPIWYELRISPLNGPDGQPVGWMGVWHEITHRKLIEADLIRTSMIDQLTGLHNRMFFEEEFARIGRGRIWPVAIIMGDLDNMKTTNDQKGHLVGDDLLRHTADVFRGCLRGGDLVARIGGDEFAVALPGCGQSNIDTLMRRLRSAFAAHNLLHPNLPIEISLGYAIADRQETLLIALQEADKAMYIEKNRRKGFPAPHPTAVKHPPA